MDNNFEILKNIDNEELYSKTFISFDNLNAIKSKNFEAFTRFKLMGFIDILSKRLNLDLSNFRQEATQYFDSIEPQPTLKEIQPKKVPLSINSNRLKYVGIGVASLALFIIGYMILIKEPTKDLTDVQVSPPSQVVVEKSVQVVDQNLSELNATQDNNSIDQNQTIQTPTTKEINEPKKVAVSKDVIKIVPRKKVWVGIVDLDTKEKVDYTIEEELIIDRSKNQIIVVNGTYISLFDGEKEHTYNFDGRVRFLCKDGNIKEIRFAEFKSLNDGKAWK